MSKKWSKLSQNGQIGAKISKFSATIEKTLQKQKNMSVYWKIFHQRYEI